MNKDKYKYKHLSDCPQNYQCTDLKTKVHSFLKLCLHDLHFMKTRSISPKFSKLAKADFSSHLMKTGSLCRIVHKMNGF